MVISAIIIEGSWMLWGHESEATIYCSKAEYHYIKKCTVSPLAISKNTFCVTEIFFYSATKELFRCQLVWSAMQSLKN